MDRFTSCAAEDRKNFIQELLIIGCCDLCVIRYLGVSEPYVYRDRNLIRKLIHGENSENVAEDQNIEDAIYTNLENSIKIRRRNTCVACVGLLEDGTSSEWLDQIAAEVKKSDIEAASFCPALSIPICLQIRAYSIWFHMEKKFKAVMDPIQDLKPEGMSVKAAWKWICTSDLRTRVDTTSEWDNNGSVSVQINPVYEDETKECSELDKYLFKLRKGKRKNGCTEFVTRGAVEATFKKMSYAEFLLSFKSPPSIPSSPLRVGSVVCVHSAIFVAGRYCKYSRKLSQTPWILDNVRKTDSSVEEEISNELLPFFKTADSRFSSSGREDVDVRTLGKGRPFVFEILNPKRTIFTVAKMQDIQNKINSSSSQVSVRDLQIVDKKDLGKLKFGEESKTKTYCALCITPGSIVTPQQLLLLNSQKLPIVLKQKTPIRVLHRRSLATRDRSILEMEASPVENHPEIFILRVKTQAGTYVKEFVHGDFGRTTPCVAKILESDADILALDVVEVDLDWPPEIEFADKSSSST